MPLLLSKPINEFSGYAVWNIQETNAELLRIFNEETPENYRPLKLAEWMVGRILVKNLCSQFGVPYSGVYTEETGKPVLKNHTAEISISHSFPMAAVMIHLKKPCGIDLERPRVKLMQVRDKFVNGAEVSHADDLEKLCAIWCAKEVLYKIHSRKKLSLKDDTLVEFNSDFELTGIIRNNGTPQAYPITIERVRDYLLAYSL